MANLLPHLIDMPMSLGEHLGELRRRLIIPVLLFLALFTLGFAWQTKLKLVMVYPLERAVAIIGPVDAAKVGLPIGTSKLLQALSLSETLMVAIDLSMVFAVVAVVPVLLYQLWMFVAVGLKRGERRLGFLFIPGAVGFFYFGLIAGYFLGLPLFYAWMIKISVYDPSLGQMNLRLSSYFDDFVNWTVCFGLVMDIPWLVMVLIRIGLVSPAQMGRARRYVLLGNLVLAAVIVPDPTMMLLIFLPMQVLFEGGLLLGRLVTRRTLPAPGADR